ncbi:hypothetical protein [Pseudoduganella sp. UC29_71]|uniref:hypothetical protein n=1 Tax=Pseudoduganella sp. UC29_71 TaxID=3350174 RepID=UPI00366C3E9E
MACTSSLANGSGAGRRHARRQLDHHGRHQVAPGRNARHADSTRRWPAPAAWPTAAEPATGMHGASSTTTAATRWRLAAAPAHGQHQAMACTNTLASGSGVGTSGTSSTTTTTT